uniref:Uncharacterized protein n=1 Tax=Anguilla anguilla TaxID=7936 RepID=A0A0E9PL65_ANGAN
MPTSQPVPLSRPHYSGSTLLSRSECNTLIQICFFKFFI